MLFSNPVTYYNIQYNVVLIHTELVAINLVEHLFEHAKYTDTHPDSHIFPWKPPAFITFVTNS